MKPFKVTRDWLARALLGDKIVPEGLVDLHSYFRRFGPIQFEVKDKNGLLIARSQDFRYGSIITSGKNRNELDANIKDAILTSFEVPSVYADKAAIIRDGERGSRYALA